MAICQPKDCRYQIRYTSAQYGNENMKTGGLVIENTDFHYMLNSKSFHDFVEKIIHVSRCVQPLSGLNCHEQVVKSSEEEDDEDEGEEEAFDAAVLAAKENIPSSKQIKHGKIV
jgi:hypothetical protein